MPSKTETVADRARRLILDELSYLDNTARSEVTDAHNIADLGADSLDGVEIVITLEQEFSIDISVEDAERLKTVGDYIACVERAVIARGSERT